MPFIHKNQSQFYIDYAPKDQTLLTEDTFNLPHIRAKKENNDTYNRLQISFDNLCIPWVSSEIYEIGELVSFDNYNYECIVQNAGKEPKNSNQFWKQVTSENFNGKNFNNYLAKDNQEPYNPADLKPHETRNDYHPATKKYVDDGIDYAFENRTAKNSDKLDGHDSTYFASELELRNVKETYVKITDIIDNTKSIEKNKPLSANQGKVLRDEIEKLKKVLKSNDVTLDELQEIIDYIKKNREKIESLGIDQVLGLREALNNVGVDISNLVPKNWWNTDIFRQRITQIDGPNSGIDADLLDGFDSSHFLPKSDFNNINIKQKLAENISGLNADLLDGLNSDQFLRRDKSDFPTSDNTFDLGNSTKRYRQIHASDFIGTALRAKYADLAETYKSDEKFEPGTILGISNLETFSKIVKFNRDTKLLGVVAENPGIIINSSENGNTITLKGKTPVKIKGNFKIGDYVLADSDGFGIAVSDYNFEESKRLIGIIIEILDGKAIVKI